MARLNCCASMFGVLHAEIGVGENCTDALAGAIDLLESIIEDLQADIDAAEDYDREAND